MLQFYDKKCIKAPLVSALALAALGLPASATTMGSQAATCTPDDGYSTSPAAYAAEVNACLTTAPDTHALAAEARIAALSERHRAQFNLPPLAERESLQHAARAHALDMVARGYADHVSPEGLDHLDRVRRLDRSALFGATGANIAILPPGADAINAFNALISDPVNADNLRRPAFSHSAVGVAVGADGRWVVVQLFAKVDAVLQAPVPHLVSTSQATGADFIDASFDGGDLALKPLGARTAAPLAHAIVPARHRAGDAAIEMKARLGTATFTLHGPVVTIEN